MQMINVYIKKKILHNKKLSFYTKARNLQLSNFASVTACGASTYPQRNILDTYI